MKGAKILFQKSTKDSDCWETPDWLFEKLNEMFKFTLDPCATSQNAKCKLFFTIEDNGLAQWWGKHSVFINPPYSDITSWVKKASEEATCKVIVMLLPARTDTKWWHDYINDKAKYVFLKGRLKFKGGNFCAPFPSVLVFFHGDKTRNKINSKDFKRVKKNSVLNVGEGPTSIQKRDRRHPGNTSGDNASPRSKNDLHGQNRKKRIFAVKKNGE